MSTTDEIILLTDEFTGLEYSWRKIGAADANVNNVLIKNIGNYKYERIFEVADVRWWGVEGDGNDESSKLNQMLSDIKDNKKVNEVAFYGLEKVLVASSLEIKRGDLIIDGKNCELSSTANNDIVVFNISEPVLNENYDNVHVKNFISGNAVGKQTFIKAKSSKYLRITDCRFNGMKLGFDLTDCLFTKINAVYFQSVYQAFKFAGTNAFNMTGVSVHGAGIPSELNDTTMGGNISGCNFEDASGRLVLNKTHGVSITGCYFEGYAQQEDAFDDSQHAPKVYIDCKEFISGINISGNIFYVGVKYAIYLDEAEGITITGNHIGTLHAVKLNGNITQKRINYNGNYWNYEGTIGSDPSEFIGNPSLSGKENISPEWNIPVIFTPKVFNAREFKNGEHQIVATAMTESSTNENYLLHTWQKNGKTSKAFLNGSIDLFGKNFVTNEELDIPIEPFGFGSTLGTLMIQNGSFQFSMFLWQRNINSAAKTGHFKQIINELNLQVEHFDGYFKITNLGEDQYLKAELKV